MTKTDTGQALGWNGRAPQPWRINRIIINTQIGKRSIYKITDRPQRMIGPHLMFKIHI
ncbi:hypothetical protein [Hyphomonas sp. BRH_c22]|uniref:hypothetical protein n=1 Tax=Hyphomonas sp. BRH_c22 TaxID=1629710 RepID=UPI0026298CD9|nr:hypothetical protein [Hyphomonas sp. BRH_c22]